MKWHIFFVAIEHYFVPIYRFPNVTEILICSGQLTMCTKIFGGFFALDPIRKI